MLECPPTMCVYEVLKAAFFIDTILLLALQQISYSDSNYDNTSVDADVSVIRN